jgi:hypothetical protein
MRRLRRDGASKEYVGEEVRRLLVSVKGKVLSDLLVRPDDHHAALGPSMPRS